MKIAAVGIVLALSGCVLAPDSVRPELEHLSHLTQHEPFTDHPTDYGANTVNLIAHWDLPARAYLEVGEGYDLSRHYPQTRTAGASDGEIIGPREEFTARFGIVIGIPHRSTK
jgi:hypothetical protein